MSTVSLEKVLEGLTAKEREEVSRQADTLISEELTLRDLRRASRLTQESLAKTLNVEQETISRLERRADLLISTLSSYVQAMGGKLRLLAEFPDRLPVSVVLSSLGEAPSKTSNRQRDPAQSP